MENVVELVMSGVVGGPWGRGFADAGHVLVMVDRINGIGQIRVYDELLTAVDCSNGYYQICMIPIPNGGFVSLLSNELLPSPSR